MYSRKTLILYCAASISVTVAVGVIFVETVYPSIRGHLQTILLGRELETSGDFNDPALAQWARQEWDRLILETNERFDPKTLNRFIVDYTQLGVWENMFYLGVAIQKYPSDLMMMQQIILEVQPDVIIETGTSVGGSALFFAHTLDGLGLKDSRVITLDLFKQVKDVSQRPLWKQYVEFIHASSTDPIAVENIREKVKGKKVLVTLDSDHRAQHVYRELELYSTMVSPGSYLIVEDTLVDGIPLDPDSGPGPMTALNRFLATGGDQFFERDVRRDALIFTQNRGGWLRRKATPLFSPPGQLE